MSTKEAEISDELEYLIVKECYSFTDETKNSDRTLDSIKLAKIVVGEGGESTRLWGGQLLFHGRDRAILMTGKKNLHSICLLGQ